MKLEKIACPDDSDNASLLEQNLTEIALDAIRQKASDVVVAGNGVCIWCGDSVEPTLINGERITGRWCSEECQCDYIKWGN